MGWRRLFCSPCCIAKNRKPVDSGFRFFYAHLSCAETFATCFAAFFCAVSHNADVRGRTAAHIVKYTMFRSTFYFQTWICVRKLGVVGNFFRSLFLEALTFGFAALTSTLSLNFNCRSAAAVVMVACAVSYMTGQFCHFSSFFPKITDCFRLSCLLSFPALHSVIPLSKIQSTNFFSQKFPFIS